jgi:hypothetical protein
VRKTEYRPDDLFLIPSDHVLDRGVDLQDDRIGLMGRERETTLRFKARLSGTVQLIMRSHKTDLAF